MAICECTDVTVVEALRLLVEFLEPNEPDGVVVVKRDIPHLQKLVNHARKALQVGAEPEKVSANCPTCGKQILTASTAVASGMMSKLHEYFCTCTRLAESSLSEPQAAKVINVLRSQSDEDSDSR